MLLTRVRLWLRIIDTRCLSVLEFLRKNDMERGVIPPDLLQPNSVSTLWADFLLTETHREALFYLQKGIKINRIFLQIAKIMGERLHYFSEA